ncbi:MAG: VWA domain-containing protein, partial [Gemmatimonadetes bacterium]|nr:VWA domain-containing protein [Gemmatimonadota bacterium]
AQGWIEPPERGWRGQGIERLRTDVQVRIEGRVARVVVNEWFKNHGARMDEGDYLYPVPASAVFESFSLYQGEEELRGEIMDADRARAIYEEIVRRRKDPALIELAGHGLLRARIFPIEAGDTRRVTLRYSQLLDRAGDAHQFRYAAGVENTARCGTGDRTAVTRCGSETPELSIRVVVDEGEQYLEPFSPTHALTHRRDDGQLVVDAEGTVTGRFALFLPLAREGLGLTLATHRPVGDEGYFMLTLSPGRGEILADPRDVTVVLDVSGSMSGEKIRQAQTALNSLLGTLAARDRFRLIAFSNAVRPYSADWTAATPDEVARARRWVNALQADGGTNIGAALEEAFRLETPGNRLPVVVFLTDGIPSVGEMSVDAIASRAEAQRDRRRVFAFGVGNDVNTHLLDRLTAAGRGSTSYVQPGESVERPLSTLAVKIRHPVLTDLILADAPVQIQEIYPVQIPDVFAGEELVLFGRYSGPLADGGVDELGNGRLVLNGRRGGETEEFTVGAHFPELATENAFIPRLWASRKLGHLTRQIWLEGPSEGLIDEIRRTALRYGLPSEYTSYLVMEQEGLAMDGVRPMAPLALRMLAPGERRDKTGRGQGGVDASNIAGVAQGAVAVEMAEEARRMREMSTVADLRAEEDRATQLVRASDTERQVVAGRLFVHADGVWRDAAMQAGVTEVVIRPFSDAYFRLLEVLPELKPYWQALDDVVVAGEGVNLRLGEDGIERLSPRRIQELVRDFREKAEGREERQPA